MSLSLKSLAIISLVCVEPWLIAMDEPFQCKVPTRKDEVSRPIQNKTNNAAAETENLYLDVDDGDEVTIGEGAKDIACAYATMIMATFMHECGHALARLLLYQNRKMTIHIGLPDLTKPQEFLRGPLVINSFNPFAGGALCTDRAGITPCAWKDIIISLAGPICGALWSYWHYKWLMKKYPRKYILSKGVSLFSILNNGLNLVPFTSDDGVQNDGMRAYRALKSLRKSKNK